MTFTLAHPSQAEDLHLSIVSMTSQATGRSRQLAAARRELSRKTEEALKRQRLAAEEKAKLEERSKYLSHEHALQTLAAAGDDQLNSGVFPPFESSSGPGQSLPKLLSLAYREEVVPKETVKPQEVVQALQNVAKADQEMNQVQRSLKVAALQKSERRYQETLVSWRKKETEQKRLQQKDLNKYSVEVKESRHNREAIDALEARELQQRAAERLKRQAATEQAIREAEDKEKLRVAGLRKRDAASRIRKEQDTARQKAEEQREIAEERERDKLETKEYEEAKEKRRIDIELENRRIKQEAWAWKAKQDAEQKRVADAEVKRRFKASETKRVEREAIKVADEKVIAKKNREIQKQKITDEANKRRIEKEKAARAAKEAHEAAVMATMEIVNGQMKKVKDPAIEQMKKMRQLEEERILALKERDAEIAAKEAAFEKAKKEEAFQRQLQVEAAQREVATTFKKNQENELRARLAREAAEKERYRQLSLEARAKIDAQNKKDLEAQRQLAENLKEMKAMQYEADLASSKRDEKMRLTKAKHNRSEQEADWEIRMAWVEWSEEDERLAQQEAMRLFREQRACKRAEDEELRQRALLHEQEIKLLAEEVRADDASKKAQKIAEELAAKEQRVHALALSAQSRLRQSKANNKASRYLPASVWKSR